MYGLVIRRNSYCQKAEIKLSCYDTTKIKYDRWTETMNRYTNEDCLTMYINGDNNGLAVIYNRYYKLFLQVSRNYICNTDDASDIVHSVIEKLLLLDLFERKKKFGEVRSIPKFFYTVIKNASIDFSRKSKASTIDLSTVEMTVSTIEADDLANYSLEYENIGLTTTELLYFEQYIRGKKVREISKMFLRKPSTIKNVLTTAKRKVLIYYKSNSNYSA